MNLADTLQQAMQHHQQGQLPQAQQLYESILQQTPTQPDANHNLGVLYLQQGQLERSLLLLRTALEANLSNEQYWRSYLETLLRAGKLHDAQQILDMGKQHGLAGEWVNELQTNLDQQTHAATQDTSAPAQGAQAQSAEQQVEEERIKQLYQNGQLTEVELACVRMTQSHPHNVFGWKALGTIYLQQNRHSEAASMLEHAISCAPQDAELHYNLGNEYLALMRQQDAIASYQRALGINPQFAVAWCNLGNAQMGLQQTEAIKSICSTASNEYLKRLGDSLNPCKYILGKILKEINENPPALAGKGGMIANGIDEELDKLRKIASGGKEYLIELQIKLFKI